MRRLPGVGPRIDRISPGEHPPHGQGRGGARRLPFPSRAALPYRWVVLVHLIDGTYELFRYFLSPAAAFDRSAPEELRAVRGVVASILGMLEGGATHLRSEERRVGKECRSRWSPYH